MDAYCRCCGRRADCGFYRTIVSRGQKSVVVLICPKCAKDTKRYELAVFDRPVQK